MGSAVLALAAWFPPCAIYTSKSTHLDAAEASTFAGLGVGLIYSIFFFSYFLLLQEPACSAFQ